MEAAAWARARRHTSKARGAQGGAARRAVPRAAARGRLEVLGEEAEEGRLEAAQARVPERWLKTRDDLHAAHRALHSRTNDVRLTEADLAAARPRVRQPVLQSRLAAAVRSSCGRTMRRRAAAISPRSSRRAEGALDFAADDSTAAAQREARPSGRHARRRVRAPRPPRPSARRSHCAPRRRARGARCGTRARTLVGGGGGRAQDERVGGAAAPRQNCGRPPREGSARGEAALSEAVAATLEARGGGGGAAAAERGERRGAVGRGGARRDVRALEPRARAVAGSGAERL